MKIDKYLLFLLIMALATLVFGNMARAGSSTYTYVPEPGISIEQLREELNCYLGLADDWLGKGRCDGGTPKPYTDGLAVYGRENGQEGAHAARTAERQPVDRPDAPQCE